jgi:hypothetical protein
MTVAHAGRMLQCCMACGVVSHLQPGQGGNSPSQFQVASAYSTWQGLDIRMRVTVVELSFSTPLSPFSLSALSWYSIRRHLMQRALEQRVRSKPSTLQPARREGARCNSKPPFQPMPQSSRFWLAGVGPTSSKARRAAAGADTPPQFNVFTSKQPQNSTKHPLTPPPSPLRNG